MTREEAWSLLTEYNQEAFHLRHAVTVEGVMRWMAGQLGYEEEAGFWANAGLLHDLDFEKYPEEHCIKSQEIMREKGVDERLIHATASHGWGITVDVAPEHEMEKVLFACDELTGLIGAAALMRPSKSVQDMELKSLKKNIRIKSLRQAARAKSSRRVRRCSAGSWTSCWQGRSRPCGRTKRGFRKFVDSHMQKNGQNAVYA